MISVMCLLFFTKLLQLLQPKNQYYYVIIRWTTNFIITISS